MQTVINSIRNERPYGNRQVSLTQVARYWVETSDEVKNFLTRYGTNLERLTASLEGFMNQMEGNLAPAQARGRGRGVGYQVEELQVQEIRVLPSVTEVLTKVQQLQAERNVANPTEAQRFEYFVVAVYTLSLPNENGVAGSESSAHLITLFINSGFNLNAFLDAFEGVNAETAENSIINELCTNLNELAKSGKIDPVIGRDDEILRTVEVLGKRKKNNPALIGKAGVGKTAIAEGLALKIIHGDVPDTIKNGVVFQLEVANMVAGTQFRGQFEEKMMKMLKEFEELEEKGNILPILFIDELHSIVGSGNNNGLDFANIIKPALAKGKLRCIGATTGEEWQKFINQDKALKRRFSQVDVNEPSRGQTIEILKQARRFYEAKHEITYSDEACERAVDLAVEFITDSALPDKAIDLFDLTGSICRIQKAATGVTEVRSTEVEYALHRAKGIALDAIREQKAQAKAKEPMGPKLQANLFGQDQAIKSVVEVLEYSLAGLQDDNKPLGSFLFIGPTGVGKTELAKLLAKEMKAHFERIDMSEFMEPHSISKFIGAPPGYVGFDQGGRLTKVIEKNPRCVLLLDEMEKSHPKVQEIMLQAMDNAKITDSQGNEINFKNVLILMTSNVGARDMMNHKTMGIQSSNTAPVVKKISKDKINEFFSPEFQGRLNGIIEFNPLAKEFMIKIVDKKVKVLNETKLRGRGRVELDEAAKQFILDKGYNPALGARPIEDTVKKYIYSEVTRSLLYGEMSEGKKLMKVSVNADKSGLVFTYANLNEE